MNRLLSFIAFLAAVVLLAASATRADLTDGNAADALAPRADIAAPALEEVRALSLAWIDEQSAADDLRAEATALWEAAPAEPTAVERLEHLAAVFALVEPRARAVVDLCAGERTQAAPPVHAWLREEGAAPLVRHNLRLLYGRWLVQQKLYDEALAQLDGLRPGDVVDPASLLFFQSVVYHRLLEKEAGLAAARALLDDVADSPRRYRALATLIQSDLAALEDESLDHIARRMEDVGRRLDLGRAGKKVRDVEDGVIASLDKLIKEMEEQQQQSSAGGAAGGNTQPRAPAPDSMPIGGKGPGDVERRSVGGADGWGDLPPKEREEALQQIGKDFPPHYRDAIEQYFRRLAAGEREN